MKYRIAVDNGFCPRLFVSGEQEDYYFSITLQNANVYTEEEIDENLQFYIEMHPEYTFTKRYCK